MKVLSLFDGISVLRCALGDREVEYHAAEIDKYAIEVSKKNYPDIKRLGDVKDVKDISGVYLLCGGSPCQDLSISKKGREGLKGTRSKLFWEWVRIWKESKPAYFILENVASMPKEDRDIITAELGVQPIMIDAALVSAQSRKRLFWTNIPVVGLPADRNIKLKDILEPNVDETLMIKTDTKFTASNCKSTGLVRVGHIGETNGQANRVYSADGKSVTLSANGGGLGAKTGLYKNTDGIRKLTPVECERLQSLPDGYTAGISNTQRYKCLGNAFNCEVIKFIVSFLPCDKN